MLRRALIATMWTCAACGAHEAGRPRPEPPVGEWKTVAGVRKPWPNRPGERGPLPPSVPAEPALFLGYQGFFPGGSRAEIHSDGAVFWPSCDAREGWVSHVDVAAVGAAFDALRKKIADGRLAADRARTRESACHDDVRFDVVFVEEGGRTHRWSWTFCETRVSRSEEAMVVDRELGPLYALAGPDPCRVDAYALPPTDGQAPGGSRADSGAASFPSTLALGPESARAAVRLDRQRQRPHSSFKQF